MTKFRFEVLCRIVAVYREWLQKGLDAAGSSASTKEAEIYAEACAELRAAGIDPDYAETFANENLRHR